jgi:hypothetical protein
MRTFLPVADFEESARLLDSPHLRQQRVETRQVLLRALKLPDYCWTLHPMVCMWRGRTAALVAYGLATVRIWWERGFADITHTLIAEFVPTSRASARRADVARHRHYSRLPSTRVLIFLGTAVALLALVVALAVMVAPRADPRPAGPTVTPSGTSPGSTASVDRNDP